jgi:hypothetical protein
MFRRERRYRAHKRFRSPARGVALGKSRTAMVQHPVRIWLTWEKEEGHPRRIVNARAEAVTASCQKAQRRAIASERSATESA